MILLLRKAPSAGEATPEQIKAGNYRMKHRRFQGLGLTIENRAGTIRRWGDPNGKHGQTLMRFDYGYVKGSLGSDGDHVDCYVGPNPNAKFAYIVHQRKAGRWSEYDEDKAMLGFNDLESAKRGYLAHYDDPRFLGPVTVMPMDDFKRKVRQTRLKHRPKMIKALFLGGLKP